MTTVQQPYYAGDAFGSSFAHTQQYPQQQQFVNQPSMQYAPTSHAVYTTGGDNIQYAPVTMTTTTVGTTYQATGGYAPDRGYWIQGYRGYMHPIFPTILNFFVPGSGHLLIKQNGKAISLFISFYVFLVIVIAFGFIIIGFFLIPVIVALWLLIMADGWQLASRLRHGYPIMKGECTNSIIKFCSGMFKDGPVFVSGKPETWPEEYRTKLGMPSVAPQMTSYP